MKIMPKIINNIANKDYVKNTVKKLANHSVKTVTTYENGIKKSKQIEGPPNLKLLKTHLSAVFAAWFGILYNICIYKEKDIPKERRNTLIINSTLTTTLGIIIGYAIDKALDKPMGKWSKQLGKILDEVYDKSEKGEAEKLVIAKGFKSIVPMLAFVFACRFVAPVIATPLAEVVNKYLVKHNIIKNPKN